MAEFTPQEKFKLMKATADQLVGMIKKRLNNRMKVVQVLEDKNPLEGPDVPKEVQQMREIELMKVRAVMQEQLDLIEIIKMLYPDA